MSLKISQMTSGNPALGTDELPIARPGSPGSVLSVTAASIAALAGGGGIPTPDQSQFALWTPGLTSNQFTFVNDQDTQNDSGASVSFNTATSTTNYSLTQTGNRLTQGIFKFWAGRNFTFKSVGGVVGGSPSNSGYAGFGLADSNAASWWTVNNGYPTGQFVMFLAYIPFPFTNATWHAVTGDGSNVTDVNLSIAATARDTFEIDFTTGTSAVFKINGTVVTTISTHLPATAGMGFVFSSKCSGGGQTISTEYNYISQASV